MAITSRSILVGIAFSVVIVSASAVLYAMAQQNDPQPYRGSIAQVRQVQQLAAEWSVETARVRSDPLADYDALVAFIPQMETLKSGLLDTIRGIADVPDRLANDVSAYASAIDAKEERIERFKTANSVVRNSTRYLPLAAANIVQNAEADTDLAREVGTTANEINDYLAAPTDAAKGRLTAVVERLGQRAERLPNGLANAVTNFTSHARVLLDRQGPMDEIFEQATSSDISNMSARLITDLGTELGRVEQRSTWFMNGMLGAAAALLLVWIAVAVLRKPDATKVVHPSAGARRGAVVATAAQTASVSERDAVVAEKLLMTQRILSGAIGERIAAASSGLAASADALPIENGAADDMRRQAREIAALAERLSSVSNKQDVSYDLLDINDCIPDIIETTGAEGVATVTTESADVPEVFASKTEICLMLEKILENSVQAIQEKDFGDGDNKGDIRITTDGADEKATVTVFDNGHGMTADVRARMFEPFYTSKDDRDGVGLTTTRHLVEKYGGTVSVSSHVGGGTVTRIELPGMVAR
ncbi:MAG: GHKL domain-containing protein [Gammaproteobacteria bacterium]|nr:GHKL domain-containing protein [Gammaproteobacteria bacterium]